MEYKSVINDALNLIYVKFEPAVICEYLDDMTPGSLRPDDPLETAVIAHALSLTLEYSEEALKLSLVTIAVDSMPP